ncbi:cobyric acid synthase [Aurantimonas sp. Leaf443]|uniref:cobyric acid synthase n=1 Tax=Aurantimonas sp. Leaf443 TaxID=1736378 RepID=UPI0006FAEF3F|nr:cobyric acid synthase [Aurantimonas sp. Leaf443]KQT88591.1 cobalamin biosynthesis protein CobQ [Aurantimonas sp. Leaf443]
MIQGTGSDVGKSLIVAGLARAYVRRGLRVAPFKPQNMSNNAAVTADGGEIGRAQALQARAAGLAPSVHMNPVLLKPQSQVGAQIVVRGRVAGQASARDYQAWKPRLMERVLESFAHLRASADLVLVEGAGSASEINLRVGDIANMGFARAAAVPVILVGDIDRGGVIAQIVGTRAVVDPLDAAMVRGFIVNRFRGDPTLFADGMTAIERLSGWPSLGLVPHLPEAAHLPAEDALSLGAKASATEGEVTVAAIVLPSIANFDDLDPLEAEPGLRLVLVRPGEAIPPEAALVVLPGSKTTIADLGALHAAGLHHDLAVHHRRGGAILGVCGGYQMLGTRLRDPHGLEGPAASVDGLGFLDVETILTATKSLAPVSGLTLPGGIPYRGYEMHVGETSGPGRGRPFGTLSDGRAEGARSADGLVAGTYVHGLFTDDRQRAALLRALGLAPSALAFERRIEDALDALADHLERHVDLDRLLTLAA